MKELRLASLTLLLVFSQLTVAFANEEPLPETDNLQTYCSSCYINQNLGDWITNVTFNTINNSTSFEGPPCFYGDYTALTTTVTVNQTYALSVTFFSNGTWTEHVRAWIDWNQNDVFDASESYYLGSGIDATLTINITIPNDAVLGETRMRVIEQFGSDPGGNGACDGQGSHTGTYGETEDYSVFVSGTANDGYVTGVVFDSSSNPINGALVEIGNASMTVGPDGVYFLAVYPLTYSGTASEQYHNSITIDNIAVVEADTTTVDFILPTPLINVDTSPIIIDVTVGQTTTLQRNIANVGDGILEFDVDFAIGPEMLSNAQGVDTNRSEQGIEKHSEKLPFPLDDISPTQTTGPSSTVRGFGDEIFNFNVSAATNNTKCLGIEFDGEFFWVSGSYIPDLSHLYKLDAAGNHLATYLQANSGPWGWRDLTWDGEYLYGSRNTNVDVIDPANGQVVSSFNGPEDPNRALAYDPATEHFWTANFVSPIYEFDKNGNTINTYANTQNLSIYGMAWDEVSEGGPFLWLFSQDGPSDLLFSQFDPATGQLTGVAFNGIDNGNDQTAGGCAFTTRFPTNPQVAVIFGLQQNIFDDVVKGYEIRPYSWWLAVDPTSGVLQPTENIDLNITIDLTGQDIVADSTYQTTIFVENNTPNILAIPVIITTLTGIEDDASGLPREYLLAQNYPNPFNPSTTIRFALPKKEIVTITLYNVLGESVAELVKGNYTAGVHEIEFNAANFSNGLYFYSIKAGEFSATKKMLLIK